MKKVPWLAFAIIGLSFAGFSPLQNSPSLTTAAEFFAAGQQLYDLGKYKQASDTLAKAANLFEQFGKPIDQVRSANLQAECLSNLGQCDAAGALLQKSLVTIQLQSGDNRAVLADTYYYLSRHAGGCARKFDEAIGLMRKSLEIKTALYPSGDPSIAFDYTFLGYIYNSKGRYDSALIYLDQANAIRAKNLKPDDIETSHTLFNLAASYEGKSQLGKALEVNQRALSIRTNKLGPSHVTVANSINSIGRVYRKLGNQERALEYYRQALEIRKNTLGATHPNVAGSYYEIGNLYGNISNYHSALEYIQQGNRILESNSQVSNDVLPTYIAYAGKLYGLIGDNDNAKAYIQKAVSLAEKKLPATHPYRAVVYNIAGEYYGETGDIKNQSEYFKKAIAIYRSSYGEGSEREADVLSRMASVYARLGQPTEAVKLYNEAITIYLNRLGAVNPKTAAAHLGIAEAYTRIGTSNDIHNAAEAYGVARSSVGTDNRSLELKIKISYARFLQRLSTEYSHNAYLKAIQLADEISNGYNNEAARIQLEKERRELYDDAMKVAWSLYSQSHADSILQQAFSISEKSKAALLLENTRDQNAKTMAGVPDSLVDKERDMRIELAYYKTNLYQAEKTKDTSATRAFEKNIFDTERKLEQFKSQVERSFPAYYKLKYTRPDIDLARVQQKLPENTTILQYFVGDSSIYCFQISKKEVQFNRLVVDLAFREAFANYQMALTDFNFMVSNPTRADRLYVSTARALFSSLMIPKPTEGKTERLIIIPDEFLAQLNFGTLLYDGIKGSDFASYPYLNSGYIVSYAYTTAHLNEAIGTKRNASYDFAGFAPSYKQYDYVGVDSIMHPMVGPVVRSGSLPLPGAIEEVNIIRNLMDGKSWLNEEATETNFKKHASDYNVLHLAMHSLLNDDEPRYSELLFNHAIDTTNDGYLTISEIYNLRLNAELVVLSACSSGFGKVQRGEGVISLSRAFSYAGCPSVVMSLWKVPDLITTKIMKNFYESLADGMDKDEALRAAQQKFLRENADPLYRHPYYWAGFVVIGDTSPLQKSSRVVYYVAGIIVVAAGVALTIRRRSR